MRLSKLILCFVFLPCLAFADSNYYMGSSGVPSSVSAHCDAGCTGEADADSFCVDNETGAAECGFTDTDGGISTIVWNASHIGSFCCADGGAYALQITSVDTETNYTQKDLGVSKTTYAQQFYFLIHSETLANGESYPIARTYDVSEVTGSYFISVKDTAGTLNLRVLLNQGTDIDLTSTKAISLDTWYRVRIYYVDEDAFVVNFSDCDGANNELVANAGVGDVGTSPVIRYVVFGSKAAAAGTVDFQIDNAKGDDGTTISTGCE